MSRLIHYRGHMVKNRDYNPRRAADRENDLIYKFKAPCHEVTFANQITSSDSAVTCPACIRLKIMQLEHQIDVLKERLESLIHGPDDE